MKAGRHSGQRASGRSQRNPHTGPCVRAVSATIAILRLLSQSDRPLGVNAIARSIARTPSSCFNILKTLVAEGFVDFDGETKCYSLGPGLSAMARHALDPNETFACMRERIERLADEWSLTVALWRVVQKRRVVLVGYACGIKRSTRIHLTIGQRMPLLSGAPGRCIAAMSGLSEAEIAAEFPKLRWEAPPTLSEYLEQVAEARRRSWALDEGQLYRGVTSIAAPIMDGPGQVRYCLVSTMFSGQHPSRAMEELARKMLETCAWASRELQPPRL